MGRLHALDALRGMLALWVACTHVSELWQVGGLTATMRIGASLAVLTFFAMSGYVLARAYDGRYFAFLLRRLVRLWPVYLVCLVPGIILFRQWPTPPELALSPTMIHRGLIERADLPAWSLCVEAAMTPALPLLFALARVRGALAVTVAAGLAAGFSISPWGLWVASFAGGVWLTRAAVRWPQTVPAAPLWLGKVSYSLYLSHWPLLLVCRAVLHGDPARMTAAMLLLVLPVAWVVWRFVERPSIRWSRAVTLAGRVPAAPVVGPAR